MSGSNQLFAEALFAGGRRHSAKEEELCEDAVGFHFFDQGAFFYLADGTSDESGVGPFSSRYLANSLGYYFIEAFLESHFTQRTAALSPEKLPERGEQTSFPPPSPLLRRLAAAEGENFQENDGFPDVAAIFNDAWKRLSQAWEKEFDFFLGKEENRELLKKALAPFQDKKNNREGHILSFSATFCAGTLLHKDRSLHLVKVGDLDIVIKDKDDSLHRLNSHRERLFVQAISCPGKKEMKLAFPDIKYKERTYRDVEFMVAKSDGVRFINDAISFDMLRGGKKENLLKFRKLLTKGYDKNIGDDKALLYLMYLENS